MGRKKTDTSARRCYPALRVMRVGKPMRARAWAQARCAGCRRSAWAGELSAAHLCAACEELADEAAEGGHGSETPAGSRRPPPRGGGRED